jgi:hypothetical protein
MSKHLFSKERIVERARSLDNDQSGAIAMLVMAATLIVLMMALVLFDAGFAARDKIDVQVAADTAAWSQAAVEARSMNLMAFTNVAKRVTFGMMAYYEALWMAWGALFITALALAIAACVAAVLTLGALKTVCKKLTEFTVQVGIEMANEAPDLARYLSNLRDNYFHRDLRALDAYQHYLKDLTPWWSWAEGLMRGARNGALVTASFPVPKDYISGIPGAGSPNSQFGGTGIEDALPVARTGGFDDMCWPIYTEGDFLIHTADYLFKSRNQVKKNWKTAVAYPLAGAMAMGFLVAGCGTATLGGGDTWKPFLITEHSNGAAWQLSTSTLTFAYEPNMDRMSDSGERKKYNYLTNDYNTYMPLLYDSGGYWALSRAEFSFQFDDPEDLSEPDLWHASYTARMRPVALPGEWGASAFELKHAYRDTLPYLLGGGVVLGALDGAATGEFDFDELLGGGAADLLRIELAVRGLNDDNIDGVAK